MCKEMVRGDLSFEKVLGQMVRHVNFCFFFSLGMVSKNSCTECHVKLSCKENNV